VLLLITNDATLHSSCENSVLTLRKAPETVSSGGPFEAEHRVRFEFKLQVHHSCRVENRGVDGRVLLKRSDSTELLGESGARVFN
jgi:hypothetical protein